MRPQTESALADMIKDATGPLRIRGGGTRDVGAPVVGDLLDTSALSGVTLYEPGALTMVAQAGTPLVEIEAQLAAENQRLAFEPGDWRDLLDTNGTPTIGGVVAANVSGPRRVQTGACRDHMLGVRFVDGAGVVVKNGGRVMKNVTGYDLVKVMTGAWGTLGVLTEVSFKVLARPETEISLCGRGLDASAAIVALSQALGSPYDVTGAAHAGPGVLEPDAVTLVRIEGLERSVSYRAKALRDGVLKGFECLDAAQSAKTWRAVRDVSGFAGAGHVWRVSVKPSDGPRVSHRFAEAGHAHRALFDWGGGLVWLHVREGSENQSSDLREIVTDLGGHATLIKADASLRGSVPVFQPENPIVAQLSAQLRARFDPRGILNPGLMG